MNNETIEKVETVEKEKPYKFRELCAGDIPLMTNVIKAVGLKEFKSCLNKESVTGLLDLMNKRKKDDTAEKPAEEAETAEEKMSLAAVGVASAPLVLDIVEILLENLEACGNALFKLLSATSNLSFEDVKKLSLGDFASMVDDFIKKEEFSDFFRVVLKSRKLVK